MVNNGTLLLSRSVASYWLFTSYTSIQMSQQHWVARLTLHACFFHFFFFTQFSPVKLQPRYDASNQLINIARGGRWH
jgi:hypothetical protein